MLSCGLQSSDGHLLQVPGRFLGMHIPCRLPEPPAQGSFPSLLLGLLESSLVGRKAGPFAAGPGWLCLWLWGQSCSTVYGTRRLREPGPPLDPGHPSAQQQGAWAPQSQAGVTIRVFLHGGRVTSGGDLAFLGPSVPSVDWGVVGAPVSQVTRNKGSRLCQVLDAFSGGGETGRWVGG